MLAIEKQNVMINKNNLTVTQQKHYGNDIYTIRLEQKLAFRVTCKNKHVQKVRKCNINSVKERVSKAESHAD